MTDRTSNPEIEALTPEVAAARRLQGRTIGKVLREQYESVLSEPVPAELLDLLDALELNEGGS